MTENPEHPPTEDDAERAFRALLPTRPPRDVVNGDADADGLVDWPPVITDGTFTGIEYVENADGIPAGIVETTEQLGFRTLSDE